MSNLYRGMQGSSTYAGLTVDVAEESLDRVQKLLAGIPGGIYKAVGGALARAAAAGKTAVKEPVAKEYAISQSQFLQYTRNINHFQKDGNGGISVVFGYRGNVIPLLQFNTKVDPKGQVSTNVKRSGTPEKLDYAFVAQMGSHRGVYERIGVGRFPVQELYGPATPQMVYSSETVTDTMEEKMAATYEIRIEHEIMRLLNGWGGR